MLRFLIKTGSVLFLEIIIKVSYSAKFVPEHFLSMVLRQGLFVGGSSKRFWAFPFLWKATRCNSAVPLTRAYVCS